MKELAIKILIETWRNLVKEGEFTKEEMEESLIAQIGGYEDTSLEDLTDGLAEIMGYDIDNITDVQMKEWYDIVNEAAERYMR